MRLRIIWLVASGAFFLMSAAWALALPINGTYDEKNHIVRAYAVAHGDLYVHGRAAQRFNGRAFLAPASLLPSNPDCTWNPTPQPASCQHPVHDRTVVVLRSDVSRYSPVYYLPVGIPMLISPDATGVVLGRLVSALLAAMLLASAVVTAVRSGNRLLVAALALVSTPMALNLYGAINPNGLEIAAGVSFFVSFLALLREPGNRRLTVLTGLSAFLLLTVREIGPLLLAMSALACLVMAAPRRRRSRPEMPSRLRELRWWVLGGFLAAGVVFAAWWDLSSGISQVVPVVSQIHAGTGELARRIATERVPFYLQQIVGQFSYGETTISKAAVYGWYAIGAALVVPALLFGAWRARLALVGLFAACFALLIGLEAHFAPVLGWSQHGRYVMPALVGVVVGAAFVDRYADWLAARGWLGWFVTGVVVATAPIHLYALARVMTRFQVGIAASLNPFAGSWHPAAGSALPLAACLLGLLLLVALSTRNARNH